MNKRQKKKVSTKARCGKGRLVHGQLAYIRKYYIWQKILNCGSFYNLFKAMVEGTLDSDVWFIGGVQLEDFFVYHWTKMNQCCREEFLKEFNMEHEPWMDFNIGARILLLELSIKDLKRKG